MTMKRNILLTTLLACTTSATMQAQRITATHEIIDCGNVTYEQPVTAKFELRNKGNDLVINNVRTSCGCATATWPQGTIAKGDKFEIAVTYDARQLGHFEKDVAIYSNASDQPFYLKMRGVVVDKAVEYMGNYEFTIGCVRTDKNDVEFDDVNKGERPEQKIHFVNNGTKPISPVVMHLPSYLSATVSPTTVSPGRTGVITLSLNSQKLRDYGLTQSSVYLGMYPGDKVSADKEITVSAVLLPGFKNLSETQKLNAPTIWLSHDELNLGDFGDKQEKSGTIIIENHGKSVLDISKMQMLTTGLKVKLNKTRLQPGESAKRKITAQQKLLKMARSQPRVLMITNDPERPKVMIKVVTKQ